MLSSSYGAGDQGTTGRGRKRSAHGTAVALQFVSMYLDSVANAGETMEHIVVTYHPHPLGWIRAQFTPTGLSALTLPSTPDGVSKPGPEPEPTDVTQAFRRALERYFSGAPEAFEAIPLDLSAATDFQREVWAAARAVTWGHTSTYGDLAERLGRTKGSARAVGHALGANPIAVIIPCHRFLAANGDLVNFAAGLHWKRELLRLEGALIS